MNEEDQEVADLHKVGARVAARAEIQDVRLLRTNMELERQPEPGRNLTYKLSFDSALDRDDKNTDWFVVRIACDLRIEFFSDADSDEDEDEELIAGGEFEYAALFSCSLREGDDPFTEDELSAYGATTARFLLYPFIREYIHDITGRFALPPLTIGVLSRPMP